MGCSPWPHLAMTGEPRGFSRVVAGFSSYDGDLSRPRGLALGETHMQRGRQNHMDKSLPSRRALVNLTLSGTFLAPTETPLCVKLGTQHIQSPPGSQTSSRGEAKDSALLSSRDPGLLEPSSGTLGPGHKRR